MNFGNFRRIGTQPELKMGDEAVMYSCTGTVICYVYDENFWISDWKLWKFVYVLQEISGNLPVICDFDSIFNCHEREHFIFGRLRDTVTKAKKILLFDWTEIKLQRKCKL